MLQLNAPLYPTPDGVMAITSDKILVNDEVFDSIYLLSPTWGHLDDIKNDKVKAQITADGKAIVVTKPRIPCMFYCPNNVSETESCGKAKIPPMAM